MLTKFYCWLFGHRFWAKTYSNAQTGQHHPLTGEPGLFWTYEKLSFCEVCGYEPPREKGKP